MKFGKQILSQQISGWGSFYLDYKSLKKIINSLEKGRLTDAALFASGIRPEHLARNQEVASALANAGANATVNPRNAGSAELQAHKAAFFFKLERELEKINAFYLQKEAELKARLQSLVDKKQIIIARRGSVNLTKGSPSYYALYEGFRYFEKDLSKLQQFIEVNATGFRKILKKWDKRSKSQTKELYLARQVEVQPCFNREFIAELSDIAAAHVLELDNISESKPHRNGSMDAQASTDGIFAERRLDFAAAQNEDVGILADLEENLSAAIKAGNATGAKEMQQLASQTEDGISVARVVWRALLDADADALQRAIAAGLPDYTFIDDINSRTCLHEACIAGNATLVQACVQNGVRVGEKDIYGRTALSYAAMTGHAQLCTYLLSLPKVDPAAADLDGFSPLVLAVMNGHSDVVDILLAHSVSVEATTQSDLIPLCLASVGGHAKITSMLLAKGAKIIANTEGLTPQALAAREGHADCLQLLVRAGADANVKEKGSLWTPLFFAAENGHLQCIRVLVAAGAQLNAEDEKGRNPSFYAAWKGHVNCLLFILEASKALQSSEQAPSTTSTNGKVERKRIEAEPPSTPNKKIRGVEDDNLDLDLEGEIDGIPSLSLPPPIIPFRTYGHNYLDKRALITVAVTSSSVRLYKYQDPNRPEQFSTSSMKLVMTSRSDAASSAVPHTIVLPLADEREVLSFQVEALDKFSIEWELMPTFGSKVIGKAVALPSLFESITDRKRFVLPLQDIYLKVVGEISFELDCVKPFDGVQLEIGGRVETYWKSTLPATAALGSGDPQRMTPTGGAEGTQAVGNTTTNAFSALNSSTNGVPAPANTSAAAALNAGLFVTASSLSGEHLRVAVQVTKDGVAVVYPDYTLPVPGLDVYVGSVTSDQFTIMAKSIQRHLDVSTIDVSSLTMTDWKLLIARSMITLEALLSILPFSVGIDIDVLYPSTADVRGNPSLPKIEVNVFVDAILHTVYQSGTSSSTSSATSSRKLLFSSRSPTVCTALNWKQPNYAVMFASYCGLAHDSGSAVGAGADGIVRFAPCDRGEPDARRSSVSEAVRFAKSNNLLGIMVDAVLLNNVPQLVHAIKSAGLLLITIGAYAPLVKASRPPSTSIPAEEAGADVEVPDGSVQDGIVIAR
jgi:CDK inhibitor PHO81